VEAGFLQHEIYRSKVSKVAKKVEKNEESITFKLNGAARSEEKRVGV
jgi:hypothetical protein